MKIAMSVSAPPASIALQVTPRLLFAGLLAVGAGMLGAALVFQYAGGLFPCRLCLFQRVPYGALILIGLAGLATGGGSGRHLDSLRFGLGLAGALAFAVGGGVAAFHVGVEQGWWQAACLATGAEAQTTEDLRAAIMAAPVVFCDDIAWSLFGISMAGWNLLASIVYAVGTLMVVLRWPRGAGA